MKFFFIHKRNHHPNVISQQNVISILELSVIAFDMEFSVLIAVPIQTLPAVSNFQVDWICSRFCPDHIDE